MTKKPIKYSALYTLRTSMVLFSFFSWLFNISILKFLGILSSVFSPLQTWQTSELAFALSTTGFFFR